MNTSAWIALGLGAFLWVPFLALVIRDWQERRRDREAARGAMRLAALREQHRQSFGSDHPDRERLGFRKGEE